MKILDAVKMLFLEPKKYSTSITNEKNIIFLKIFIASFIIKTFFLIISPHQFPEELSFEKAGIVSPSLFEYIFSGIFAIYLFFSISVTILSFNIKNEFSFIKTFFTNIIFAFIILSPLALKSKIFVTIFIIIISLLFLIFSITRMKDLYIYLLKTFISLQIITSLSSPFIYITELLENETIYIILNLTFSLIYMAYYIKLIKYRFEISIARILLYSLLPVLIYYIIGFSFTKIEIFTPNISKLILYH